MYRKNVLIIATGALIAGAAAAQNQSLSDLLKGGVKSGGSAPPKQQPAPQQQPPPPRPQQRPPQQPPAPQAAPPASAGAGFRMQLPPGWRAELTANRAVVARSADQASSVLIAPVMAPAQITADEYLRRFGGQGLRGFFPDAAVVSVAPSRLGRSGALASLQFKTPAGPGRAAALLFISGGLGTLYAIGAPAAAFGQQQASLIQILKSFSFDGQGSPEGRRGGGDQPAANLNFTRFTDRNEGSFFCDVPAGWKTDGGLVRKSTVDVRGYLRVSSPDGGINIFVGDPNFGTFITLTQTLAMSGFREGSQYSPGYGNVMIVRRYFQGLQFAQEYAGRVAQYLGASQLQSRDARPRPDLSGGENGMAQEAWTAGEISFTCNLRGREGAGYVLAATKLTSMYGTGIWNVSTLVGYVAPAEQVGTANAVLQRIMQTFQVSPQWFAQQQQTTAQTSQIVTETNQRVSKIINDSYWSRQRALDRTNQNFSDHIRGVVRLRDPDTGEELEGRAGNNYYWRVRGTNTIVGNDHGTPPPTIDVTELQQIG